LACKTLIPRGQFDGIWRVTPAGVAEDPAIVSPLELTDELCLLDACLRAR
jgi:hypothetical protein